MLFQTFDYQEHVVLTRQLAALVLSATSIDRSLSTIYEQARDPVLKRAWMTVHEKVTGGHTLSNACALFPKIFSPFYLAMVKTGETTGQLDEALARLAQSLERTQAIRHKVRSALVYPAFVLGLTLCLTMVVFVTVIPGFVEIFRSSGMALPLPTQILILIADSVANPGLWLVGVAVVVEIFWLSRQLDTKPELRLKVYQSAMALPLVGSLLIRSAACTFSTSMHTLITCGMPLDRSLRVAAEAPGNPAFEAVVKEGIEQIMHGVPLSMHMAVHPEIYPPLLVQMIQTGEETSTLDIMFARVAQSLETDLDNQVEALSASLEPLLLLVVAGIVAFIVMAIFLPLYGTLDQIG